MNHSLRHCLLVLGALALSALSANAQGSGEVFDDPEGKFSLKLPPGWHSVINRDALGKTEVHIVYGVRENGSLRVKAATVDATANALDFAKQDEDQTLRFQPAYAKKAHENFVLGGNKPNGALISYDYSSTSNQPMTGRNYYLRLNETTIYVLTFRGRRNILGSLRNQTDSIARSLVLK